MWQNKSLQMVAPIKSIYAEKIWPEALPLFTSCLKLVDRVVIATPGVRVELVAIEDPVVPLMNNSSGHCSPEVINAASDVFESEGTWLAACCGHVVISWEFVLG